MCIRDRWEEVAGPLERSKFQLTKAIKKMIDICNFTLSLQALFMSNNQRNQIILPAIDFLAHSREISKDEREFMISQAFAPGRDAESLHMEKSNEESDSPLTKPNKTQSTTSTLILSAKRKLYEATEHLPAKVKILETYQEPLKGKAETKEEKQVRVHRRN
eukprot:TRINITY_DN14911_c0_g2_i1.p1 TRINITY_DN14911_c0_g2~~TRINITY_DN14911_c0_g2_i1.p1  ORF type:complete len:161 (+),score=19.77 TRINITY_DN14911_c0_g2_i1:73-555(+)